MLYIILASVLILLVLDVYERQEQIRMMLEVQWNFLVHLQNNIRVRKVAPRRTRKRRNIRIQKIERPPPPQRQRSSEYLLHPHTSPSEILQDEVSTFLRASKLSELPQPESGRSRHVMESFEDQDHLLDSKYVHFSPPPRDVRPRERAPIAQHVDSDSDSDDEDYMDRVKHARKNSKA